MRTITPVEAVVFEFFFTKREGDGYRSLSQEVSSGYWLGNLRAAGFLAIGTQAFLNTIAETDFSKSGVRVYNSMRSICSSNFRSVVASM